jgi:hypothetical protein
MTTRSYSELIQYNTFEDRLEYLTLRGGVGDSTFGFDRYINQDFYHSAQWRSSREEAIVRDNGCDLGVPGYDIHTELLVHHMNPVSADDIVHGEEWILDPEYLITTTKRTHNAIHYGTDLRIPVLVKRTPGDTALW